MDQQQYSWVPNTAYLYKILVLFVFVLLVYYLIRLDNRISEIKENVKNLVSKICITDCDKEDTVNDSEIEKVGKYAKVNKKIK